MTIRRRHPDGDRGWIRSVALAAFILAGLLFLDLAFGATLRSCFGR
jgi:hypothetical protein